MTPRYTTRWRRPSLSSGCGGRIRILARSGQLRTTKVRSRLHSSANHRHFPIGFVGGNRDVRGAESQPFSPAHQLVSEIVPLEFRLVKLGIQVVVVEDESHAEELEEERDQENRVGRIAGLENAESGSRVDPQ